MVPIPNYEYQMYGEHRKIESSVYIEADFFWHFRMIHKAPRILVPALIYLILDWLGILFTLNMELPNIVSFPLILIQYSETVVWIQQFPLFFVYLGIKSIYDYILFPIWVTILVREALTENQPPLRLLRSFAQTYRFVGLYLLQFVFLVLGIIVYLVGGALLISAIVSTELAPVVYLFSTITGILILFYTLLIDLLGVTIFIVGIFRNKASFKVNFKDAWFIIKHKGTKLIGLSMSRNWILIPVFVVIALVNWGIMLLNKNSLSFSEVFGTFDLSFYIMVFLYVNYISLAPEIKNYVH